MRTLLQTIEDYDLWQRERIRELEEEVDNKDAKIGDLTTQLASYVATVDRMKLDLILSGALRRPESQPESAGVLP